jgi:4-hydroxybenzoate polyprenyltransferase
MIAAVERLKKAQYIGSMNDLSPVHSDIPPNDWVERQLPPWARPFARLMRLDRPTGTWLLLLPCLWGVTLAGGRIPVFWFMILFGLGAVVMRGAGCIVNDIYDRRFDRKVERTKTRPLASGDIAPGQAIVLLAVLLLLGLGILLFFNRFTFWLGIASLPLVFTYPLAKRYIWFPQLVLGLAFNWGALMGWSAVRGSLDWPALFLYMAGIFWTLGYDTIYAHQDKRDDAVVGVKSLALKLGDKSQFWVAGFYDGVWIFLALAGYIADAGRGFYLLLIAAIIHAAWQVFGWRMDDPVNCLQRFQSNRDFGLIVWAALLAGRIF